MYSAATTFLLRSRGTGLQGQELLEGFRSFSVHLQVIWCLEETEEALQ